MYNMSSCVCIQIEELIVQLGIRKVSADAESVDKQSPAKPKLKTAKVQHDHQLSDDEHSAQRTEKDVAETKKKKGGKVQHDEVSSTTTKAVDWIANYQMRCQVPQRRPWIGSPTTSLANICLSNLVENGTMKG